MPSRQIMIFSRWWHLVGLLAVLSSLLVFRDVSPTRAQGDTGFVFTVHGDHGAYDAPNTLAGLTAVAQSGAAFSVALGDLSYENVGDEQRWCQTIQETLGPDYPFEVVVGNHEDEDQLNGYIGNFVEHCPDRLQSQGIYGAEYFFDYPADAPLMRMIMIGAGNDWDWNGDGKLESNEYFDYDLSSSSGQLHSEWLVDAIDSARAAGIPWVVVGMHKDCLTVGIKTCEIGTDLMNLLLEKHVDLVLQGHDHTYQRSKQLALGPECAGIVANSFDPACVADDGSAGNFTKGAGTVVVVTGHFGANEFYAVSADDPEVGYFAKAMGGNGWFDFLQGKAIHAGVSRGFVQVEVSADALSVTHIPTTNPATAFEDQFSVIAPQVSTASAVPDNAGRVTIALTPAADAYVDETNPESGRGKNVVLRVDASPPIHSYLQFDLQDMQGAVITSATLRIYANSASKAGYAVQTVFDGTWTESDLTPGNAPVLGVIVATSGAFEAGTWTSVDVTDMIPRDGVVTLALSAISNTSISFSSRQGANPPELVLEVLASSAPVLSATP